VVDMIIQDATAAIARRIAMWAAVACLAGAITACAEDGGSGAGDDDPAFAIDVEVWFPGGAGSMGAQAHWEGEAPAAPTTQAQPLGIRKTFATRAEALAFGGAFVALAGGVEVGRATVAFSACDLVADVGLDPADRRRAVFRYVVDVDGRLAAGSYQARHAPIACDLGVPTPSSVGGITPLAPVGPGHELVLWAAAPRTALRVELAGAEIVPDSVGTYRNDQVLLGLRLPWPADADVSAIRAPLAVVVGGLPAGPVDVSFERCIIQAGFDGYGPADIVRQENDLQLAGATLSFDLSDYTCFWSDGGAVSVESG